MTRNGTATSGRRPPLLWSAAGLALLLVAVGLWAFQPWRLLTSRTVREAPPVAAPPEADLGGMTSVVIWCDRFSVAFGSAPVRL